jgi:outer membrane protein OmpA-like peptidoglycan-associated protein
MRTQAFLFAAAATALLAGGCATHERSRAALVRAPATCVDQAVQIYFDPNSAELTREGRLVIHQAASAAAGCRVASVEVLGLADAQGAPDANLELSKRRAAAVAAVLAADGLPAAEFKVGGAGQAGAVTAEGKAAPLRRRADIILHLAPKG